jgi:hypothetical protein
VRKPRQLVAHKCGDPELNPAFCRQILEVLETPRRNVGRVQVRRADIGEVPPGPRYESGTSVLEVNFQSKLAEATFVMIAT